MPTFAQCIKLEGEKPANTIRLILSGKFLRAYNQSAWLFQCCIAEFDVVKKYVKSASQNVYFVGFPVEKIIEKVGGRKTEKTQYGFDVTLSAEEMPAPDGYETWQQTVETVAASTADHRALPLAGVDAEREVLRRLREWPIACKTPMENTFFLSELHQLLNNK